MIFCVEDETSIRNLMQYTLNTAGFETKGFSCAEEPYRRYPGHYGNGKGNGIR